jgi:hypothetical protein
MATERQDEIIEVLECEIDARPKAAPGVDQLLPKARGVSRVPGALLVEFDPQVVETLAAFVEAERLCCAGIGWDIERDAGLHLRIAAGEAQLTVLESLWKSPSEIEEHR